MNFRIFVVQTPESVLARFMYDGGTELLIDRTRASDIAGLGDDDRVPGFQCCEIGNDRRDSTSNLDHDEAAFFRKRGRERFDLCGELRVTELGTTVVDQGDPITELRKRSYERRRRHARIDSRSPSARSEWVLKVWLDFALGK